MKRLFNEILHQLNHGQDCMLVSIVGGQGSTPRSSGARMLVNAQGRVYGTIGGGAVEFRGEQQAQELLKEKRSLLYEFRLNKSDTDGLNMVCGGNVTVLFRYINAAEPLWSRLCQEVLAGQPGGGRLWLLDRLDELSRPPLLLLLPAAGESAWPRELPPALAARLGGELPLRLDLGREGSYYAEPLPQSQRVLIFGGGHIARELAPVLAHLDFRVTVFEDRPEYADPATLPGVEAAIVGDYANIEERLHIDPEDFVIIMTWGHACDYTVQRQVMALPHAYLGVIGSRGKTATLNRMLLEDGFTQEQLKAVHTPIGLAIQAQTPAEIAISIAAELIQVRAERRGVGPSSCPV